MLSNSVLERLRPEGGVQAWERAGKAHPSILRGLLHTPDSALSDFLDVYNRSSCDAFSCEALCTSPTATRVMLHYDFLCSNSSFLSYRELPVSEVSILYSSPIATTTTVTLFTQRHSSQITDARSIGARYIDVLPRLILRTAIRNIRLPVAEMWARDTWRGNHFLQLFTARMWHI